jgi:hypothetical protein
MFGGILRSVMNPINLVQIAMGPAGWASLAMRQIGAQIGMNVLQQLGQRFGLPQPMIDLAQASFAQNLGMPGLARQNINEAVNGLADQFNLSPRQTAEVGRAAQQDMNNLFERLSEAATEGRRRAERDGDRDGRSWLQVIADNMSAALDAKVTAMDDLAQSLEDQGQNRSTKTANDLTVQTQEFSYLMQATSSVLKTIGEGLTAMARKQ